MARNRPYIHFEKVPGTRFIGVQILSSPTRHIISLKVYGAQSSRHQDDGTTFFGYDEYMPLPFGMGIKSVYQFSPKGFIRLAEGFNPVLWEIRVSAPVLLLCRDSPQAYDHVISWP